MKVAFDEKESKRKSKKLVLYKDSFYFFTLMICHKPSRNNLLQTDFFGCRNSSN